MSAQVMRTCTESNKAIELNVKSGNVRSSLKNISVNMIKKNPFFGVGFRNFLIKRNIFSEDLSINPECFFVHPSSTSPWLS